MRPKSLHDLRGRRRKLVQTLGFESQDRVDAILDDERTSPDAKLALLSIADQDKRSQTFGVDGENFVLYPRQVITDDRLYAIILDHYVGQGYEVLRWYPHNADAEVIRNRETVLLVSVTNDSHAESLRTIQVTVNDFKNQRVLLDCGLTA